MAAELMWALLPVLLLGACSPPSDAAQGSNATAPATAEQVTDRAALGGPEATLVAHHGACLLRQEGAADVPLAPAPPCRFLRVDGQVQQHAYPDRGIDAVVIVVGTPAEAGQKAHFGASATAECGTVAHGLIVRGTKVTAAREPHRGGMFCVNQGRDEKDFYAVSHER